MHSKQLLPVLFLLTGLAVACKKDQEKPTQPTAAEDILFVSQEGSANGIGTMKGDGSNVLTVISPISTHRKPVVSHRGDRILFYRYEGTTFNLYAVNRTGGPARLLVEGANLAAWSPDDSKIAFVRAPSAGVGFQLFVINSDGSQQQQVTHDGWAVYPTWFPDGQRLLYGGEGGFYTIKVDGTGQQKIDIRYPDHAVGPVLSPDGTQIAFSSGSEAGQAIYVMKTNGNDLRQVAFTAGQAPMIDLVDIVFPFDGMPVWSPDGTRLSYNAFGPDKLVHVYVVGANGGKLREVSEKGRAGHSPSWSADGQRIYYTSSADLSGVPNLTVVNAAGGQPFTLSNDNNGRLWPIVLP